MPKRSSPTVSPAGEGGSGERRVGGVHSIAAGDGGSAAVQSFKHIHDVGIISHQTELVAFLLPLSIDGMMGIATIAMAEDKAYGRLPRRWARTGLWFGLLVSLAANVASIVTVWGWDWVSITVAGLPPVEIVSKPGRLRQVAQIIADVGDQIGRLRPPAPATNATAETASTPDSNDVPADGQAPDSTGQTNGSRPAAGRRGRPEDDEPLDDRLIALALKVGRAWRKRTGREVTRDGLRTGLRDAGWERGISNVTAGRLLDAIRTADGQDQDVNSGRPELVVAT
jgi:hypothetical protein